MFWGTIPLYAKVISSWDSSDNSSWDMYIWLCTYIVLRLNVEPRIQTNSYWNLFIRSFKSHNPKHRFIIWLDFILIILWRLQPIQEQNGKFRTTCNKNWQFNKTNKNRAIFSQKYFPTGRFLFSLFLILFNSQTSSFSFSYDNQTMTEYFTARKD